MILTPPLASRKPRADLVDGRHIALLRSRATTNVALPSVSTTLRLALESGSEIGTGLHLRNEIVDGHQTTLAVRARVTTLVNHDNAVLVAVLHNLDCRLDVRQQHFHRTLRGSQRSRRFTVDQVALKRTLHLADLGLSLRIDIVDALLSRGLHRVHVDLDLLATLSLGREISDRSRQDIGQLLLDILAVQVDPENGRR